jgi:ankyrin repeat protein
MKTYKQFNESIRDHLKPKSMEDIIKSLGGVNNVNDILKKSLDREIIPMIKYAIENGADVNKIYDDNQTPLYKACLLENFDLVKLLLEKGADVNSINDNNGENPLYVAVGCNNYNLVKLLIDKGSDVNQKRWTGYTPLMKASHNGYYNIVKLLIDNGADINYSIEGSEYLDGVTPLFVSIENARVDVAKLLIDSGADLNHKTPKQPHKNTPMKHARYYRLYDIVELLKEKGVKE